MKIHSLSLGEIQLDSKILHNWTLASFESRNFTRPTSRGRRVGRAEPASRANCMLLRTALLVAALGAGRVAGDAPFDVADFIKAGDGASAPVASTLVCAPVVRVHRGS